jgi:hypothetical protein
VLAQIEIRHDQWKKLLERLEEDYPRSVVYIREKMKRKLGFVERVHKDWDEENQRWRKNCVMLDFYNESKQTFFIMKYSEYLDDQN